MPPLMPRENGDKDGYERHNGDHMDPYGPDGPLGHHKSPKMPPYPNGGKNGGAGDIAGYVPTQRLEWKRYKQYTRSDIMAAIEEVKKGKIYSLYMNQRLVRSYVTDTETDKHPDTFI